VTGFDRSATEEQAVVDWDTGCSWDDTSTGQLSEGKWLQSLYPSVL